MKVKALSSLEKRKWVAAYLFIAPIVILFTAFRIYPAFFNFALSFMKWNVFKNEGTWVGLKNYARLLEDETFFTAFKNTLLYTGIFLPIQMTAALAIALLLNVRFRGRSFCRTALFAPYVITLVATAAIWKWLYDPTSGVINTVLERLNLPTSLWLLGKDTALGSVIVYSIWQSVGYSIVIFLAGLQAIPQRYYEAAEIDGASKFQSFLHITLPLLMPVTLFILVMMTIASFGVFSQIYVMTQGGPAYATLVLVLYMFNHAFTFLNLSYGATIAVVFFIFVLAVTIIELKFGSRRAISY
ncbi:sugar ABC transporter permease [Candidatus Aerophobetes bacterium]|nr:sugar ABC transporter permease [Candidatus Aerophobetes bacterium]